MKAKVKAKKTESLQQEQLLAIGDILRQTRESQAKSLDEISRTTLIRSRLLAALESATLEELPEPIYIRGLIKRYGDALGLEGEVLAIQFLTHPIVRKSRLSWKSSPAAQLRPLHLYLAYVCLMVVAVSGLSYVLKRSAPQSASLPSLEEVIGQKPTSTPGGARISAQQSNPTVTAESPALTAQQGDHPIRVEVKLTSQSWLRVVADGKTTYEGVLQEGETRLWVADKALTVRAGNAGGVVVAYNNGEAEKLGDPGAVAERTFAPTEQQISLNF